MKEEALRSASNETDTTKCGFSTDRAFRRFIIAWWVGCAVLALLATLQVAILARPVFETDEAAHMSYAIEIANLQLPTIYTPMLNSEPESIFDYVSRYSSRVDESHQTIWTANHPPLFYFLSAPLVQISEALDSPRFLLLGMRLLNCIATAVVVFLTGLLARYLVPERRVIQILAPVFVLMFRTMYYNGGLVYNDGLGVALTTGLLILTVRTVRSGTLAGNLIPMTVLSSLAALTRVSALPVILISLVAVLTSQCFVEKSEGRGQRALRIVAGLGVIPALVAGWPYLRNILLYGDMTASAALLTKFGRKPRPQYDEVSEIDDLLRVAWERFFLPSSRVQPGLESWYPVSHGFAIVAFVALVLALISMIRSVWLGRFQGWGWTTDATRYLIVGAALVANGIACVLALRSFVAAGGGFYPRYLVTTAPILACGLALSVSFVAGLMPKIVARATICLGIIVGLAYCLANQRWLIEWMNEALRQDDPISSRLLWGAQIVLALAMVMGGGISLLFGGSLDGLTDRPNSLWLRFGRSVPCTKAERISGVAEPRDLGVNGRRVVPPERVDL